ncbi:SMP-30/gluconolactonase/LRE family protein [Flagellimonas myxillae]|uniref:SMP-30/gluconolactonase/LRE family protein n=1 Tax=Flagellimonas myxillae TaxID=2942214 RepID=UPI00201E7E8F|nr:SMP-30/gluconolactonase/LRE family protein [Muricauda myxillae]MCL6267884.1 SMP-30/gluconolactonase/LRE family protein [Muricauda myxillae]
MKRNIALGCLAALFAMSCKQTAKKEPVKSEQPTEEVNDITKAFGIEILDEEALKIIDSKASIQLLASGFEWSEGPLWIDDGEYLLFSDIPNNKVYKWDTKNDTITYLNPSGYLGETNEDFKEPGSNGLVLDSEGRLVLMQHGERRVGRMVAPLDQPKPVYEALVDNYQGKRFNSPNDGFFDSQGNLYFTDPPYGLPKGMEDPEKELDFQGVYCLKNTGELVLLDKLTRPNGICLSPKEDKLYVAVSDAKHAVWYQYDVVEPGKVEHKTLFHDATHLMGKEGQQGAPDGLKVHSLGYVLATGPGGLWIFDDSGKTLARIYTGQRTSNCALSTDEKQLFLTADDHLLKVDLK